MSQGENMPQVSAEATQPAQDAGAPAPDGGGAAPVTVRARIESKFPRGLVIRLIAYLFVGHLFAFFVYLLFVLGAENQ
ncbi:DUF6126 family protein [Streptomyces subrutilus]|uniref:DUF6126 family protein n=2 Tax=Streptomyces subrutilus TaxID=36818 RepID=UPI003F4E1343